MGRPHLDAAEPHEGSAWTYACNVVTGARSSSTGNADEAEQRGVRRRSPRFCKPHRAVRVWAGRARLRRRTQRSEILRLTIVKAWRAACAAVFTSDVLTPPLAERPYDLRHAAVSTWLNGGVPATTVAEWAGHSVEVLLRIYAKCLDGGTAAMRARVDEALGEDVDQDDEDEKLGHE